MKHRFLALTLVAALFSSCAFFQNQIVKDEIAQLEQFAIAAATQFFAGTLVLHGHKLTAQRYSVTDAETEVVVAAKSKFTHLTYDTITKEVNAEFAKQAKTATSGP